MHVKEERQGCVCFVPVERDCAEHDCAEHDCAEHTCTCTCTCTCIHTRRSACSFYPLRETVFGPSLRRSMRRTKWTGFVAPAIARSHSCLFLTTWDFKGTAHWVRISMWDELWLLTEVNASTIVRISGIVRPTENC